MQQYLKLVEYFEDNIEKKSPQSINARELLNNIIVKKKSELKNV